MTTKSKRGGPQPPVTLSNDERPKRDTWARRPPNAQRHARRSRIVLACAAGRDNTDGAAWLRIPGVTVGKGRKRCLDDRRDGHADEPRPDAPRPLTAVLVEDVVTPTRAEQPKAATPGSTRGRAKTVGRSQRVIGRIGNAVGLKPHRGEPFPRATDPDFSRRSAPWSGLS